MNEPKTNYGGGGESIHGKEGKLYKGLTCSSFGRIREVCYFTKKFVCKLSFNVMSETSHHNKSYHFHHTVIIIKHFFTPIVHDDTTPNTYVTQQLSLTL